MCLVFNCVTVRLLKKTLKTHYAHRRLTPRRDAHAGHGTHTRDAFGRYRPNATPQCRAWPKRAQVERIRRCARTMRSK
jgi:hypothetical protein